MAYEHQTLTRRTILGTAAVGGLAVLTGCTRGLSPDSDNDGLVFMFWGEGDQTKRMLAGIKAFEKKSDVRIRPQYSGLDGYYDKLATQVAGGSPPDMFQIHLPMLSEYRGRGVPLALDKFIPDKLPLDSTPASVIETCKMDGKYYYVATGVATQPVIVYDTTKLTELGIDAPKDDWTFDHFQRLCKRVVDTSKGKLHGTADMGDLSPPLESFLRGRHKFLFTEDGQLGFTQDDLAEWLELWRKMRADRTCVPMTMTAAAKGFENSPLIKGTAVFTNAATSRGLQAYQGLTKHTLELVSHPRPARDVTLGTNIIPAGWFAVSKRSKHAEDCAEYLRFLLADPASARVVGLSRGVPLLPNQRKAVYGKLKPLEKKIYDNVELVESRDPAPLKPFPRGAGELLDTSLKDANQNVGFGKATVNKATDQFFKDAERVLQ